MTKRKVRSQVLIWVAVCFAIATVPLFVGCEEGDESAGSKESEQTVSADEPESQPTTPDSAPDSAEPVDVPFEIVSTRVLRGGAPGTAVIRSEADWDAFWSADAPAPSTDIDFDQDMLICIHYGSCNVG
jgi:hypothetical protein